MRASNGSVQGRIALICGLIVGLGFAGAACDGEESHGSGAGNQSAGNTNQGTLGTRTCEQGSESCACYPNQTCNAPLQCVSRVCVDLSSIGSGGSSSGGTAGASATNPGSGGAGGSNIPSVGGSVTGGGASNTQTASSSGIPGTGGAQTGGTGGASGGTANLGGTPSTGGTPAQPQAGAPAIIGFIDDFEQATLGALPVKDGRAGCWYTFKDATTTQTPVPLPTGSACSFPYSTPGVASDYAVRTFGTTSASGWAGMGFDLACPTNDATQKQPYDAAARGYTGVTFWAKAGSAAAAANPVRVTVLDRYTDPAGGICTTCNDHWYKPITLTTTWEKYALRWTDAALARQGTGSPLHALDATGLMSIQFQFIAGASFDLWIDDISFIQQ